MKHLVKRWLLHTVPMPYLWAKDAASRLHEPDVRGAILQWSGHTVVAGPFAGMQYVDQSTWGALTPKLVGSYERELHDVVRAVIDAPYRDIVVVGSAEGYYAVGLSRAMPGATVHAYDTDERARRTLLHLATLNGTAGRTIIRQECTFDELERFAATTALVVCDIEGAELHLLDPDRAPSLGHYDIIVEIHDCIGASDVRQALTGRFQSSHELTFIPFVPRGSDERAGLPWWFSRRARFLALDEWRVPLRPDPGQALGLEWGVFRAKKRKGLTAPPPSRPSPGPDSTRD